MFDQQLRDDSSAPTAAAAAASSSSSISSITAPPAASIAASLASTADRLLSLAGDGRSIVDEFGLPSMLVICSLPQMTVDQDGEQIVGYTLATLLTAQMKTFTSRVRRYTDFVRLYHSLCQAHPDVHIPGLPQAHDVVGWFKGDRFQPDFIEQRRRSLDAWLNKLLEIPQLHNDPDLLVFLSLPAVGRRREYKPAPPDHQPFDENYLHI